MTNLTSQELNEWQERAVKWQDNNETLLPTHTPGFYEVVRFVEAYKEVRNYNKIFSEAYGE